MSGEDELKGMANNKRVAIVQSCYIPWKGYFDIINMVDEFILYDDMQYTKRDWRNRNLIKTPNGLQWLTIPVDVKGKYYQKINAVNISDSGWAKIHWKAISLNYAKARYFKQYADFFEDLYKQCEEEKKLSRINFILLSGICSILNIKKKINWSTDYAIDEDLKKTDRLVALCQKAQAAHYISGPSASAYMQTELFESAGIKLAYVDYSGYEQYPQLYGSFEHGVSIIDLIFNVGPDACNYMKSMLSQPNLKARDLSCINEATENCTY